MQENGVAHIIHVTSNLNVSVGLTHWESIAERQVVNSHACSANQLVASVCTAIGTFYASVLLRSLF